MMMIAHQRHSKFTWLVATSSHSIHQKESDPQPQGGSWANSPTSLEPECMMRNLSTVLSTMGAGDLLTWKVDRKDVRERWVLLLTGELLLLLMMMMMMMMMMMQIVIVKIHNHGHEKEDGGGSGWQRQRWRLQTLMIIGSDFWWKLLSWHQWQQQRRSWDGTCRLGISSSHPLAAWFISASQQLWDMSFSDLLIGHHFTIWRDPKTLVAVQLFLSRSSCFCHLVASTKLPWLLIFVGTTRSCSFLLHSTYNFRLSLRNSQKLIWAFLSLRNFDNLKHIYTVLRQKVCQTMRFACATRAHCQLPWLLRPVGGDAVNFIFPDLAGVCEPRQIPWHP